MTFGNDLQYFRVRSALARDGTNYKNKELIMTNNCPKTS